MLAVLTASVAYAAQPASVNLTDWIAREWKVARQLPPSAADCVLTYQTFTYATADPATIAALEREVAGHPEHPRRFELENLKRRLANGGDTLKVKLWWGDAKLWRLSTTIPYLPEMPYSDTAVCPDGAWILTPVQLTIIDPAGGNVGNYDAVLPNAGFQSYVNLALHGGFDLYEGACKPGTPTLADDGTWRIDAASPDGAIVLAYKGHWLADLERGFVDSVECVKAIEPTAVGERWVFADWQLLPALNDYAARTVNHFAPREQKPQALWKLIDCERTERAKIEEAAAVPRADGVDIDRGNVTYTRVFDSRVGRDLPVAAVTGPVLNIDSARSDMKGERSLTRVLGWILAGSLVVILIILKSRAQKGALGRPSSNTKGAP